MILSIQYLRAEVPDITGIVFLPSQQMQVTYQSLTNDYYIVSMKLDLDEEFTSFSLQFGEEGQTHFMDSNLPPQKFYMVQAFDRSNPEDWDQDGMDDVYEGLYAELNPFDAADADGDLDNDGLKNLEEMTAGTNPLSGDTDGDGFGDGDEITYNSDPLLPSSLPADPDWRYTGAATPVIVAQNNATPVVSAIPQHVHTLTISVQNDAAPVVNDLLHAAASLSFSVSNSLPQI